jgi:hypothetical protein
MAERWQTELAKLRSAELPADLWYRVLEGPRLGPVPPRRPSRVAAAVTAFAVFALAGVLVWKVFSPIGGANPSLGGSDVFAVPAPGDVAPVFLSDGRPVFIVHHEDGSLSVVDAFSSHRAWGFEELNVWCPTTREFVEWAHEAHFDEHGNWSSAGPAPSGIATFAFDVVERDAAGDPASIRIGAMRAPSPGGSAPVTDPSRPPFCPEADGVSNQVVEHSINSAAMFDTPADAVAAAPDGWFAVRGTLYVASDGFVQLCAQVRGEQCSGGAIVRGIDGVGLMVNVLQPSPGSGYETNRLWLAQDQDGVLTDIAIVGFLNDR